jgi:Flp pilus assembly protein TadG
MFQIRAIYAFIEQQSGGITFISTMMFSLILSFCLLAFDGAKLITKKARLEDAINDASHAIASSNFEVIDETKKGELENLLRHYIHAYLPNEKIMSSQIRVHYINTDAAGNKLPMLDIQAQVKIDTLLPINFLPVFSPKIQSNNFHQVCQQVEYIGRSTINDFSHYLQDSFADLKCPVFK